MLLHTQWTAETAQDAIQACAQGVATGKGESACLTPRKSTLKQRKFLEITLHYRAPSAPVKSFPYVLLRVVDCLTEGGGLPACFRGDPLAKRRSDAIIACAVLWWHRACLLSHRN